MQKFFIQSGIFLLSFIHFFWVALSRKYWKSYERSFYVLSMGSTIWYCFVGYQNCAGVAGSSLIVLWLNYVLEDLCGLNLTINVDKYLRYCLYFVSIIYPPLSRAHVSLGAFWTRKMCSIWTSHPNIMWYISIRRSMCNVYTKQIVTPNTFSRKIFWEISFMYLAEGKCLAASMIFTVLCLV